MRNYPEVIHPWTVNWFETLPEAYQQLDSEQRNPAVRAWDGLNVAPFDLTESGGWSQRYPSSQIIDYRVAVFNVTPGHRVYFQVWVKPGAKPGLSGAYVMNMAETEFIETTPDYAMNGAVITGPTLIEGYFYPPPSGQFKFFIANLSDENLDPTSMPSFDAVNVSLRRVDYADLPTTLPGAEDSYYPMLRYMDGIGQIGGKYRALSDELWSGKYTDPELCPDSALRWLAQMLGVPRRIYQNLDAPELRQVLKNTAAQGLTAVGSRASLEEVAKSFLLGEKNCNIIPHPDKPHTLVVRVRIGEVPGGDLAALGAQLRATGVVPAGHLIEVAEGVPTWNQWEAAAGSTWVELESRAPRWNAYDELGLTFT